MLSEYFDPLYFLIAFAIGMLIVYISTPVPEIIFKYPTPANVGKVVYQDDSENCYQYLAKEVKCPDNKKEINVIPIQHVDLDAKEREGVIARFQKIINSKPSNHVIMPYN